MKRLSLWVICAALVNVGAAWGAEPSLKTGQQLFESTKLGTSGMSCASCHRGGKDLKGIQATSAEELSNTINTCIAGPLKGKRIDPESTEMKSLVLYVKSFAQDGK